MTPDEKYWASCARGELQLQHCSHCGQWQFPPSARCRECLTEEPGWEPISGRAVVWSWIRMHKQYFSQPEFAPPYLVGMVQLEEGPRMVSSIAGVDGSVDPELRPEVGAQLEVYFDEGTDRQGRRLPRFRLVEEAVR